MNHLSGERWPLLPAQCHESAAQTFVLRVRREGKWGREKSKVRFRPLWKRWRWNSLQRPLTLHRGPPVIPANTGSWCIETWSIAFRKPSTSRPPTWLTDWRVGADEGGQVGRKACRGGKLKRRGSGGWGSYLVFVRVNNIRANSRVT